MRILLLAPFALAACQSAPIPFDAPQAAVAFTGTAIIASDARGIADPASARPLQASDNVRIASISKLAVAIGAMQLVEQGTLDLDRPVGDWLGYEVRHPAAEQGVTLRQLLSHTSGIRDGASYALPLGARLEDTLGEADAWGAETPGYFSYANLNFGIAASAMEAATGERFDRLMERLLLRPLDIDACFNWPGCSDEAVASAVVLTREGAPVWDDLKGQRPACPVVVEEGEACDLDRWRAGENGSLFSPQGGLRISALDLARIGQMLANGGSMAGVRILTPASIEEMARPAWRWDGSNGDTWGGVFCAHGLGLHLLQTDRDGCKDDPGLPAGRWVGHSGDAYGLRSGLWIDLQRSKGIAYHAGGLPEGPENEISWEEGFFPIEQEMTARALALFGDR
ncbi:serine hydrolase domain-containing protein [Sphingomicrobium flavum]|uniref:serine hydrolase domain-containing protein n=1 Tax=Sphingomicrobium flavum TaxID=1229164 RepID=UPI0021ADA078|nr:serine hydrolase [Sphingomicrobium flavum]